MLFLLGRPVGPPIPPSIPPSTSPEVRASPWLAYASTAVVLWCARRCIGRCLRALPNRIFRWGSSRPKNNDAHRGSGKLRKLHHHHCRHCHRYPARSHRPALNRPDPATGDPCEPKAPEVLLETKEPIQQKSQQLSKHRALRRCLGLKRLRTADCVLIEARRNIGPVCGSDSQSRPRGRQTVSASCLVGGGEGLLYKFTRSGKIYGHYPPEKLK